MRRAAEGLVNLDSIWRYHEVEENRICRLLSFAPLVTVGRMEISRSPLVRVLLSAALAVVTAKTLAAAETVAESVNAAGLSLHRLTPVKANTLLSPSPAS
jgi:hypothetical protein